MNHQALLTLLLLAACDGTPPDSGSTDTNADTGTVAPSWSRVDCEGVTPAVRDLTPDQVNEALAEKDFAFLNVHVPNEGQIPGTDAHISFRDVDAIASYVGGDLGAEIVLYCMTGPMSEIASEELVARGFCNVHDMPAGMATWESLGYPVEAR